MIAGRYEVGEVIATGGMGVVRAGRDTKLDRPVAIKLLRPDLAGQPDLRARFETEARAAARISHPNVVAVFDTGEHEEVPYMIMELLSGRTLAEEVSLGPMEPGRATHIGLQMLAALEAFHRDGILHRDLKPDNVLLGDEGMVKVADFGVAKITEGMNLTLAGTVLGTPAYLAPERAAGSPASVASDLYSVGVVLYELLCGRVPFAGENPMAMLQAIQQTDPPSLGLARPDLDPALVNVIERAMAKDPSLRYADASDMARDLGSASPGEALAATQVIDVPGPATEVIGVPVLPPEPGATPGTPGRSEGVTEPVIDTAPVAVGRLSRSKKLGMIIGVALILLFLISVLRPSSPPQRPAEAPASSLSDALDRLEAAVRP